FPFNTTPTTALSTLSLHDALPILPPPRERADRNARRKPWRAASARRRSTPATGRISPPRPTSPRKSASAGTGRSWTVETRAARRSEEHTSELQSRFDLVCRLLLEK